LDGFSRVSRTNAGAYDQADFAGEAAGTLVGGVKYPLQTAMVASLLTGRAGATGKGRIYLPAPSTALDSTFRYPEQTATDVATGVKGMVQAMNVALNTAVIGAAVQVASSKGYLSKVTSVRAGRVPDTQRSRRGDLLEGYVAQVV
jgi:hypothetical protein